MNKLILVAFLASLIMATNALDCKEGKEGSTKKKTCDSGVNQCKVTIDEKKGKEYACGGTTKMDTKKCHAKDKNFECFCESAECEPVIYSAAMMCKNGSNAVQQSSFLALAASILVAVYFKLF